MINPSKKHMQKRLIPRLLVLASVFSVPLISSLAAASPPEAKATTELVSMDFPQDTDITEIAKQIARWSHKNFLWDQQFKGKIKIIAPNPVSKEEAFSIFLSALEGLGYTTIASGEVIKIMKASAALKSTPPLAGPETALGQLPAGPQSSRTDRLLTYVLPLRYTQAASLQASLSRFASAQSLIPVAATNTLIITDYEPKVARLLSIISLLDKPGQQVQLQLIRLKHLPAAEAAKQLNELLRTGVSQSGIPLSPSRSNLEQIKIFPVPFHNSVAVVSLPSLQELVRELLAKLDSPSPNQTLPRRIHVRPLEYADAKKLAVSLSALSAHERKRALNLKTAGSSEDRSLEISADEPSNSLLITGSWEAYQAVDYVIRKLDVRKSQVLLAVELLEVGSEQQFLLGTSLLAGVGQEDGSSTKVITAWQGQHISPLVLANSPGLPLSPEVKASQVMSSLSDELTIAALSNKGVYVPGLGEIQPSALIQLIKNDGDSKTLSSPYILTLDREEASLAVGEQLFYYQETTDPKGGKSKKIEKENLDLRLSFTPLLSHRQEISLRLELESNQLIGLSPEGLPRINKKKLHQALVLKDGQTTVIAGLQGYTEAKQAQGLPFLSELPFIGWLFNRTQNRQERKQLLAFVTPYSVNSSADFQRIYQQRLKESRNFWEKSEFTLPNETANYSDDQDSAAARP